MKKLKKLASRIDLSPGFRGEKKSKGCKKRDEVIDSRGDDDDDDDDDEGVIYRGSIDDLRLKPSGIIRKIYATLQNKDDREKKKSKDLSMCLEDRKKKSHSKKSRNDQHSTTNNFQRNDEISNLDEFVSRSDVRVLRYQEEAKRTLSNARDSFVTSPLRPSYLAESEPQRGSSSRSDKRKKNLCETRGCKQVISRIEFREAETDVNVDIQELIGKIQELKKSVEDLEAMKKNASSQRVKVPEENASSQTTGRFITDLRGVREALGMCSSDLSKLRKFCQSRDCAKQIEDAKKNPCCDDESDHLHTYIDGFKVVVKFPEEKPSVRQVRKDLTDEGTKKITTGSHETTDDGTFVGDKSETPQIVKEPAEAPSETREKTEATCAAICARDETQDNEKKLGAVVSCTGSKKNLQIAKKSDGKMKDRTASVEPKKSTKIVNETEPGNSQTRSYDAWYGKPSDTTEKDPPETFTSENAPRIKSSEKKTSKGLRDSKPDATEMGKVIIVVRCSPPTYATDLKMGTKTILTLRESAQPRSPPSTPETQSFEELDDDRNAKTRWKVGCVSSRTTESSHERETDTKKKWQCASSRRKEAEPKRRKKKSKKHKKKKIETPKDSVKKEATKKIVESSKSQEAMHRNGERALEPSGTSLSKQSSKTRKKSEKILEPEESNVSRSSADSSSVRRSKNSMKSKDDTIEQTLFYEPKDVFFLTPKSSTIGKSSSTKSAESTKSKSSRGSKRSNVGANRKALGNGNGKFSRDHRSVDLRPSTSGCSGKCSRQRANAKSQQLMKLESVERLSNKCQRPSRVKIELCEMSTNRRRNFNISIMKISRIKKFANNVGSTVGKNCTRLKKRVFPLLKKKSTTALKMLKKGYNNVSEIRFFSGEKNCQLDGCGSGINDCTSETSVSNKKSTTSIEMREKNIISKSQKKLSNVGSSRDVFQICECVDNPERTSRENFYTICRCIDVDSSGNRIKKGTLLPHPHCQNGYFTMRQTLILHQVFKDPTNTSFRMLLRVVKIMDSRYPVKVPMARSLRK